MEQEIVVKDCKYRLPCHWCDKYDRMCEAVLFEIHKFEQNIKNAESKECEHDWKVEASQVYIDEDGKRLYGKKYVCMKCSEKEGRFTTSD